MILDEDCQDGLHEYCLTNICQCSCHQKGNTVMALTAAEQALLESLTKKATEVVAGPEFDTVEKIVRELVRVSDKFTANPEVRDSMISVLDGLIGDKEPAEETASESN